VRHRIEFWAYRLLSAAVRVLPTAWMRAFAAVCGRGLFALHGKRVRWALENARIAFPDESDAQRRAIVRASYAAFGRNAIDFVLAQRWDEDELRARITIKGVEHLEAARERGKAVFIISAHLANFEVGFRAFQLLDVPMLLIGRTMRNARLYAEVVQSRTRSGGVELIDRKRAAMPMMRRLKAGGVVALLMDQYVRKSQGVFAPLFGVRCSTTPVPATLCLRTGAALLCATAVQRGSDQHEVTFSPIEFEPTGDTERDVLALTTLCNAEIESRIRAHPDQWMWGHRRFRYSPDLERDPYVR